MNKTIVICLGIVGLLAIKSATAESIKNIDSSKAKKSEPEWNKMEPTMRNLLSNVPTPTEKGSTLIDDKGNKSDCHEMSLQVKNLEGKTVKTWACWSN